MRLLDRLNRWRASNGTPATPGEVPGKGDGAGDATAEKRAAAAEAEARRNSGTYLGGGRGPGSRLPGGF